MADIKKLREQLAQLEKQKQGIHTKLSETKRKNATGRKVLLGVHLLKLAETDSVMHSALLNVWAAAQKERPSAFIDADMPKAPTASQKNQLIKGKKWHKKQKFGLPVLHRSPT